MKKTAQRFALGGVGAFLIVASLFAPALEGCPSAHVPTTGQAEAGAQGVGNFCTMLEGITSSGTVASICADAEEVAWIAVQFVKLFGEITVPEAGASISCKPIPTTPYCATPQQMGRIIEALVTHRRARFLLDAGLQ
jgi:hypothetical protein